jgi:hypothetical protein
VCQILEIARNSFTVQYRRQNTQPNVDTCSITAVQEGSEKFAQALPVTRSFTYSKAESQVGIIQIGDITTKGVYIFAKARKVFGVGGSSTPLRIATTTPEICSLDDVFNTFTTDGTRATIRAIKNGTCALKLEFPGDSTLLPSSGTWSKAITGVVETPVGSSTPQVITFDPIADREYGPGLYLKAITTSNLPIMYKSLTPTICSIIYPAEGPVVQSNSPKTGLDVVNCIVEASQSGDNRFAPALPIQRSFNWVKSEMIITVNRANKFKSIGTGTHFVDAALSFKDRSKMQGMLSLGNSLTVTTSTPSICAVNSVNPSSQRGGIFSRSSIRTIDVGTCELTFNFAGTTDRKSTSLTWSATVSRR